MTGGKDEYYRPWLDTFDGDGDGGNDEDAGDRVGKATVDIAKSSAPEPPSPQPASPAPNAATGQRGDAFRAGLKRAWNGFAATTIRWGESADVPAKWAALELGDKARTLGGTIAEGAKAAGKSGGAALGKATSRAGSALGDAGRKARDVTKTGFDTSVAASKSGGGRLIAGAKDATAPMIAKIAPRKSVPPVVGNALDRLVAEEQAGESARPRGNRADDLPLFGDIGDERAPPPAPVARPTPASDAPAPAKPPASLDATLIKPGAGLGETKDPARADGKGARGMAIGGAVVVVLAIAILAGSTLWGRGGETVVAGGAIDEGAPSAALAAIDDSKRAEIEAVVEAYILAHPEIIPRALDQLQRREAAAAITRLRPAIEEPFAGAWGGNPAGDVVLTEYTDFACGFCRQSLPDVERLLKNDPKLKIVYRELPILSAQSGPAAKVGLAAARKGRYRDYHLALFALRQPSDANILAAAKKAGMTAEDVETAKADPALDREIASNVTVAQQLRFEGTPTFVIGDRILHGAVGYDTLKAAVAEARKDDE